LNKISTTSEINNMDKIVKSAEIKVGFSINATINRVWDALTLNLDKWWTSEFFANPDSTKMVFEPYPGGRLFESGDNNNGILWYTVIRIDDYKKLDMTGYLFPEFGGPSVSYLSIELHAEENTTLVKVTDVHTGAYGEKTPDYLREGWEMIFGQSFKNYVEKTSGN